MGGVYGIGGGAIIAPFLVTYLGLPVYTVAGGCPGRHFHDFCRGVCVFTASLRFYQPGHRLRWHPTGPWVFVRLRGLLGTYVGARLQKYLPEKLIHGTLGFLVAFLGFRYIYPFVEIMLALGG